MARVTSMSRGQALVQLNTVRQRQAREALEQVAGEPKLSRDTSEIVTKCLAAR